MNGLLLKMNVLRENHLFYLLIFLLITQGVLSYQCISKKTCGECISENPKCAWCWLENSTNNDTVGLCDSEENLQKTNCMNIFNPGNSVVKIKNRELSNEGVIESEMVQMKPQQILIKMRPNSVQRFQVEFRQAVDYPVDLYYLMDLSNSMADDKEKLAKLGDKLAEEMQSITSNFRLGFGSFVDKTVAPFVSSHPDKLKEPCQGCAPPYSYRNHMPLSSQTKMFAEKVKEAAISGNLDAPEGGFDAIMQAVICKNEIGWRNKSRKLLVYSSDSSYHYAGDGKLGGIVEPNDETCHLDDDGYYTAGNEFDYPSFSQIHRKIREHNIHIVFAVTSDQSKLYQDLSKRLTGSSTGTLDADSANVVELIKQQYDKIQSSIEIIDDVDDNNMKLTYHSKCLGSKLEKTNICKGLKVGNDVTFDVDIEVSSCSAYDRERIRTFHIFTPGLQDQLTVHVQMQCECA